MGAARGESLAFMSRADGPAFRMAPSAAVPPCVSRNRSRDRVAADLRRAFERAVFRLDGAPSRRSSARAAAASRGISTVFHVLAGGLQHAGARRSARFPQAAQSIAARSVWSAAATIRWRTIQLGARRRLRRRLRGCTMGPGYTFPSWAPHVRLDYLFTPPGFTSRIRGCEILPILRRRPPRITCRCSRKSRWSEASVPSPGRTRRGDRPEQVLDEEIAPLVIAVGGRPSRDPRRARRADRSSCCA